MLTGKIPNAAIGIKISLFQQEPGKIDPRSGNFICSKGVRDTILTCSSAKDYSKTGSDAQNKGIVNRSGNYGNAGERSHKKMEYHIPDQLLSNILLVKREEGGNRPCINLNAVNKFIACKHFEMEGLHCLKYLLEKTISCAR